MGTGELLVKPVKLRTSDLRWTSTPRPGVVVASCYRNRDKLREL